MVAPCPVFHSLQAGQRTLAWASSKANWTRGSFCRASSRLGSLDADGFAESLDLADEVFLLPIYPARELPIPGVSSELIAEKMEKGKATVVDKDEMMRMLIHMKGYGDELEILVTAGAGDIDMMVGRIEELLV